MRAAPVPTEHEEQQALAQWLDLVVGPRAWCHVPNGGARRKVEAARMTAIGVKPGVPDILIFRRPPLRPEARGVAIELKADYFPRFAVRQKIGNPRSEVP